MPVPRPSRLVLTLTLALAGCGLPAVGPDYEEPPKVQIAQGWLTGPETSTIINTNAQPSSTWWAVFRDPLLNSMIDRAVQNNLDVRIAQTNIEKARALRQNAQSNFFPDIDASAGVQKQRLPENASQFLNDSTNQTYYDAGFDATWELDVFGGQRRSLDAAQARLDSTQDQYHDVMISVIAEVARTYAELRGAQQRAAITHKNIELQTATRNIVQKRFEAGEANNFEVTRAEAQRRVTESALPNITAGIRTTAHRLAVLTGQDPQALLQDFTKARPMPIVSDIVPVGLRSDILRRRPDIKKSERTLAAETADIGVATADLFPRFFLTGSAGLQSLSFGNLFESGSQALALGPNIQWPVFRGGEIRAQIKVQEAEAQAAALEYEKTVLTALEDVENALVRYGKELETRERLAKAVIANEQAVRLAQTRYKAGEDNILTVIDAERELASVEDELTQSETRVVVYLISLYKALGGGWDAVAV